MANATSRCSVCKAELTLFEENGRKMWLDHLDGSMCNIYDMKKHIPEEVAVIQKKVLPQWKHDCERCQFLGGFGNLDLYKCPSPHGASHIARYGNEGFQYASTCDFGGHMGATIKSEIGGITPEGLDVLVTFRLLPSLILNQVQWS